MNILYLFYFDIDNEPKVNSEWANLMNAGMTELKGGQQCCPNHGLLLLIKRPKRMEKLGNYCTENY